MARNGREIETTKARDIRRCQLVGPFRTEPLLLLMGLRAIGRFDPELFDQSPQIRNLFLVFLCPTRGTQPFFV